MKPKWTQQDLEAALQAASNDSMSKREAASTYGIPWGTFACKLTGRRKIDTSTPQTYLTPEEEQEIVKFVKDSSERGFGKSKAELMLTVQNMLNYRGRETKWENNKPSEKWYRLFKDRHPEITLRTPQKLGKQRALLEKPAIMKWFQDFKSTITDRDASILLDPDRIFNCDESGFSLDASSGRILSFVGTKFIYQIGSELKTLITVLACCNANGLFLWPMLIYPGTQFRGFTPQQVFRESFIAKSKNGWTNQTIFVHWLKEVFNPQTAHIKRPVVLLVDGHISHQSMEAAAFCRDHDIILYALPPHSSHIMQPLDVGVFKTMKAEWKKAVKAQNEIEIVLTKRTFALVFKNAYEETVKRALAPQAFRHSGLYPLDPTNVDWQKILPSSAEDDQTSAPMSSLTSTSTTTPPTTTLTSTTTPPTTTLTSSTTPPTTTLTSTTTPPTTTSTSTTTPPTTTLTAIPVLSTPYLTLALPAAETSTSKETVSVSTSLLPGQSAPLSGAAGTSACSQGLPTLSATLRKFAMICGQIGESAVNLYFQRLEEGYDCEDSLYALWKEYHNNIVSQAALPVPLTTPSNQKPEEAIQKDPLTLPTLKKGTETRRKAQPLPPLISGDQFIDHLKNKSEAEKEEKRRKEKRKLEMEAKRKEKVKEVENRQRRKEERDKLRTERKKQKEEEMQRRREARKRLTEIRKLQKENSKQRRGKKRKIRKTTQVESSDTDTSVDESQMVLEDDSDDFTGLEENFDDFLHNSTFELEKAIELAESAETASTTGCATEEQNPTPNERSLWAVFS